MRTKIISISLSVLIFFISLFIFSSHEASKKEEIARYHVEFFKGFLMSDQPKEAMLAFSHLGIKNFTSIQYHNEKGKRVLTYPPIAGIRDAERSSIDKVLKNSINVEMFFDKGKRHSNGKVTFFYNRINDFKGALPWSATVTLIFVTGFFIRESILARKREEKIISEKNNQFKNEIFQLRHDLSKPLQTIRQIIDLTGEVKKEYKDCIDSSWALVISILNKINSRARLIDEDINREVCIPAIIQEIYFHQRAVASIQGRNLVLSIQKNGLGSFSKINEDSLKRVVVNLVENSLHATSDEGSIEIQFTREKNYNCIKVIDDGHGIEPHILSSIGKRGVTSKANGSGHGLSYVKEKVEDWGGCFLVSSTPQKGTTSTIKIPRIPTPRWASEKMDLRGVKDIILVDDQSCNDKILKDKLTRVNPSASQHFCHSLEEFQSLNSEKDLRSKHCFSIFDYDLGDKKNGIDLISESGLQKNSVLMTSHYASPDVQSKAQEFGIKIFPKILFEYI